MEPLNEIYNGNFAFAHRPDLSFPDGWQPAGGGSDTHWIWEGVPPGERAIKIENPYNLPAGIRQEQSVGVPVGERQKWLMQASLRASAPGKQAYVKVYFSNANGYPIGVLELLYTLTDQQACYQDIISTPSGTTAVFLEVGIKQAGVIWISQVSFARKYPVNRLRLDTKGQVFVNHVQTVGEIQKPIRLQDPVKVNVNAQVTADIRSLTYWRDSVKVYGSEGLPLKTDSQGKVEFARSYTNAEEIVSTTNTWDRGASRDVAAQETYSFAVHNRGSRDALIALWISPNNTLWVLDGQEVNLAAGEIKVLAAMVFLRYVCVAFKSATDGDLTSLNIWYQAQG